MAQFTVYENRNPSTRTVYPYFVDVQHATLEGLDTRLVAPLCSDYETGEYLARLCPEASVDGRVLSVLTPHITNVPMRALSHPVGDLRHMRDQIVGAIDFLVSGF